MQRHLIAGNPLELHSPLRVERQSDSERKFYYSVKWFEKNVDWAISSEASLE